MAQKPMDGNSMKSPTDTLKRMKCIVDVRTTESTRMDVHKFVFKLMILSPSARFTMYAA